MSAEYLTEIDRREWSEKEVLKKILFELRKIKEILERETTKPSPPPLSEVD